MNHRIKDLIKEKGYTQQEFAEKLGIARESLLRILSSPSYPSLEKIASALDVPMWQLFASPDELKPHSNDTTITCPKCGTDIHIDISIEK